MKRVRSSDSDDLTELNKKVSNLKVNDIQQILACYNISKSGRKSELIDKLLSLIKNGKEEQRRDLIEKINKISGNLKQSLINMCSKPEVETKRLKPSPAVESSSSLPTHSEVKFKKIPFYDQLDVLISSSVLKPSNISSSEQVECFAFNLTGQQAIDIEKNRILCSSNVDYAIQVQFRICLMDVKSEQNDLFPLNFQLRVNNRICALPPFLPARPNTTPKRASKPLNITPYVKISPLASNIVEVRWSREPVKNFAVSCFLVRKLSSDNLFKRLKVQEESLTRGMIKEKLSKEVDTEIATTMLRVSLICPLGKIRMKVPCRASTCQHLQCFDALLYLQMNECKQSWICPVCDKEALFEDLSIDGYFSNVIKALSDNDNEIQLHKDGSWSKLEENVEQTQSDEGFVISDEEDANNNKLVEFVQDKKKVLRTRKASQSTKSKNKVEIPEEPTETIDLTLDD